MPERVQNKLTIDVTKTFLEPRLYYLALGTRNENTGFRFSHGQVVGSLQKGQHFNKKISQFKLFSPECYLGWILKWLQTIYTVFNRQTNHKRKTESGNLSPQSPLSC